MIKVQLLVSGLITPDGTRLYSRHRNDYQTYNDANGEQYMIDGGLDYHRGSVNTVKGEYIAVFSGDPHSIIREHFGWGSRGKDGNKPLHYIILKDMESSHIENVLETQHHIQEHIRKVFEDELHVRKVSKELVSSENNTSTSISTIDSITP